MQENLNEVNLKFKEMNFTLILVEEVDPMKELLFKLQPEFSKEYEYSTTVDLSEEKLKQPENKIFKDTEDNSELRDIMIDIMKFSNIVSINDDEAQIYFEKICSLVGKKTYEYIHTLKLNKSSKIVNVVMVESEIGNINMLDSNIIDYNDANKEKFIKMQNQVDDTNLKVDDVITKYNKLLSKVNVLSEVSEKNFRESEQLKNKCIAYEDQVEVARNHIQNLSNSLDTAHTDILLFKNELEATNVRLENLKAEHVDAVQIHDITKADLEVSKIEIENLKRDLNETKVELGNSKREQANLVNQLSTTNENLNLVVKDLKETHSMLSDILPDDSLINNSNEKDRFCNSFNKFKKEFKAMYDTHYDLIENMKEFIQEKQKENFKEIIENDIIEVPDDKEIQMIDLKTVITNYDEIKEGPYISREDFSFMMNTLNQTGIGSKQRLRFISNGWPNKDIICKNDKNNIFGILTDGPNKIGFFTQKPFEYIKDVYSSNSRVIIFDLRKKQFKANSNDDKGDLKYYDTISKICFYSDGEKFEIYGRGFTFKSIRTEFDKSYFNCEFYQLE